MSAQNRSTHDDHFLSSLVARERHQLIPTAEYLNAIRDAELELARERRRRLERDPDVQLTNPSSGLNASLLALAIGLAIVLSLGGCVISKLPYVQSTISPRFEVVE